MTMEVTDPPFITLSMHQLAKAIAHAISDYCLLADQPFDREHARRAMLNSLQGATFPISRAASTLPEIVLPSPPGAR